MSENNSIFENRLFLHYLAAAGQDIGAGKPIGASVGAVTQQNIRAQSMMKLLSKMLGGEVPEGGKVTIDSKGMKLDVPVSELRGAFDTARIPGERGMTAGPMIDRGVSPSVMDTQLEPLRKNRSTERGQIPQWSGDFLNPSSSQPGISAADLAGLTTEDISQALQFGMMKEQLGQKKITDLVDMYYKTAQIQKLLTPETKPLDQPYPVEVPGVGEVSHRQWKSLTGDQREYALYVHTAKRLDDADIYTFEEYQQLETTDKEQFLRAAIEDPKLMEAAKELARSGATRISLGEKLEEKKALGELKGQLYFKDPKWVDDLGKYISSEDVQNKIFQSDKPGLTRAMESVNFVESKILASGGTNQEVKFADDAQTTMIWTVRWPSGDVEYIRSKIRE